MGSHGIPSLLSFRVWTKLHSMRFFFLLYCYILAATATAVAGRGKSIGGGIIVNAAVLVRGEAAA